MSHTHAIPTLYLCTYIQLSFVPSALTMFPKKKMAKKTTPFRRMSMRKLASALLTLPNLFFLLILNPAPMNTSMMSHLDQANTYFQMVGQTTYSLEYANVAIKIELTPTILHLAKVRSAITSYRSMMNISPTSSQWQAMEFDIAQIDRTMLRLTKIDFLRQQLPESEDELHSRAKRFVFTAIALAVLAASVAVVSYSVYAKVEIDKMGSNVNTLSAAEAQDIRNVKLLGDSNQELIRLVNETQLAAGNYYSEMHISGAHRAAIAVAMRRTDIIEGAYEAGCNNRLHIGVLQDVDITKTVRGVKHFARALGLTPIMKFFSDWTTLDTSLRQDKLGFTLFVHVPLMALGSEMTIFRHVHIPLPLPDSSLSLTIDSAFQYIAVGEDAAFFRVLSEHDLSECKVTNGFYMCPRGNLVRRAPHAHTVTSFAHPEICLWALFTKDPSIVKTTCDHHVSLPDDSVFQVAPNKFILSSSKNQSAFVTCRNDTKKSPKSFDLSRLSVLNLYPGCSVATKSHRFSTADIAFSQDADMWAVEWQWDSSTDDLAQNLNGTLFQSILPKLAALANSSRIPLNTALSAVADIQKAASAYSIIGMLTFHMPAGISGLLAMFSILLHIIGCYCKQRRFDYNQTTMRLTPKCRDNSVDSSSLPMSLLSQHNLLSHPT